MAESWILALTLLVFGLAAAIFVRILSVRQIRDQRQLLDRLPIAAVALDSADRIQHWNPMMAKLSGLPPAEVESKPLAELPRPWCDSLSHFSASPGDASQRQSVLDQHLILHKGSQRGLDPMYKILLIEDVTTMETVQQQMAHQNRLAAIGQLAAGVAHEIGNPITGIDSLAQLLPDTERETAS